MPTALCSLTSALLLKSGGKYPEGFFVSFRSFILMTGKESLALPIAPVAPLMSWRFGAGSGWELWLVSGLLQSAARRQGTGHALVYCAYRHRGSQESRRETSAGERRPARRNRQGIDVRRDCWNVSSFANCAIAHFQSCAKRFYGPHHGRNGNGQRARCAGYPPTVKSRLACIR